MTDATDLDEAGIRARLEAQYRDRGVPEYHHAVADVERLLAALDEARAEVERLHFDLDREAHARQTAESALAAVQALADRFRDLAQQHMHGPNGNPSRAGAYAAAVREIEAALATPTTDAEEAQP